MISILRANGGATIAPILITCALAVATTPASAQKKAPEFTRQGLLITNFVAKGTADNGFGHKAADEVRSRVGKLVNKREVDVISGGDISYHLMKSGMPDDTLIDESSVRALGKILRADEYLTATVDRAPNKSVRLTGRLVLMRDHRMTEPLPPAAGQDLGVAADQFARSLVAARAELAPQRRCENALRDGQSERALQFAREAVAAYPGVLAHVCLTWALRATHADAGEVLAAAKQVLAGDSLNPHGLENAAVALDSLRRHDESAAYWIRLAGTDTANTDLTQRVVFAMMLGGSGLRAEPLIVHAADTHPDSLSLRRLEWRVAYENRHWPVAIAAGEILLTTDSATAKDSVFTLRLASAYRANGETYKAIALAARGVAAFPGDVKLYTLYTQFVKSEADSVVPRGIALFPRNADLLALSARELRAKGQLAEALSATRQALAADSTLERGELMIAQGEVELGRPDSALVALRRAVARGEDTALVAQFALGRGNALLRAANGTKSRDDFQLAMRFLALADTLRRTPQSAFLVGVAAYSITQSALSDAPKMPAKTQSCELSHLGAETLPVAKAGLEAGQEVSPDAAKQFLDYLGQLEPYVQRQLDAFCPKS